MRTPPRPVLWNIQLRIPLDERVVRRASKTGLEKALAKALVETVAAAPPEFIVESAKKLRAEYKKANRVLVTPEARPIRI